METASQTAPACQLLDRFLSAPELKQAHIKACLAAIADSDEMVQAWTYLCPPEHLSVNGWPAGLLSGIAVGIKDIIDVAG